MNKEYGVRYQWAASASKPIVIKEKIFASQAALDKFVTALEEKDGFCGIDSWLLPRVESLSAKDWKAKVSERNPKVIFVEQIGGGFDSYVKGPMNRAVGYWINETEFRIY